MDGREVTLTERALFASLALLSFSGVLLHYRIHNFMGTELHPGFSWTYFISNLFPFIDAVLVTSLFMSRNTAVYGYLLNGIIVIYGTVFMAHFSIAELTSRPSMPYDWLINSTLPDIGISWGDFFVGKALYDMQMMRGI